MSDPFLRAYSLLQRDFQNMLNNFTEHRWTMELLPRMLSTEVLGGILFQFSQKVKIRENTVTFRYL